MRAAQPATVAGSVRIAERDVIATGRIVAEFLVVIFKGRLYARVVGARLCI